MRYAFVFVRVHRNPTKSRGADPLPPSPKCVEVAVVDRRFADAFGGGDRRSRAVGAKSLSRSDTDMEAQ